MSNVNSILFHRFACKKYKNEIEPEMKNIAKLKQIMMDYIDGKHPTIKTFMIEEFAKELEKILENYQ